MKFVLTAFLVCTLVACEDVGSDPTVNFLKGDGYVQIGNYTSRTVYYFVVEQGVLALINWAPTSNPEAENRVESLMSKAVPFSEIYGYEAGKTLVIFWWTLEKKSGDTGYKVVGLTSKVVSAKELEALSYRIPLTYFAGF